MPLKLTKPLIIGTAIISFLATLEFAIPAWRNNVPLSTAPIFSLPMAKDAMQNPGDFQRSIDIYQADRGAELKLHGPNDTSITVFYFEWDKIQTSGLGQIDKHEPETCNKTAGLTLRSHDPNRVFETPGHASLVFDVTTFADPQGRIIHVYKMAWLQGFGPRVIQDGFNRQFRFKNAIARGGGAARVLECGVSGAQDESHAWAIFQEQVIKQLVWNKSGNCY